MKLHIEIIGDESPDSDRLMKALRDAISYWGVTNTESFTRVGAVEKLEVELSPSPASVTSAQLGPFDEASMAKIEEAISSGARNAPSKFKL